MTVLQTLVEAYEGHGFEICTGLNPHHMFGAPTAPFTYLFREGAVLSPAAGIALQEVYFLESLYGRRHPQRLLVIGNSFGWSTVCLALLNPTARVVAIDSGEDPFSEEGLVLTNRIGEELKLNLRAIRCRSPDQVAALVPEALGGPVDDCLVDGLHTPEQIRLDVTAVRAIGGPNVLFLLHDVINFGLTSTVRTLAAETGLHHRLLYRTPSGMAVLYPESTPADMVAIFELFAGRPALIKAVQNAYRRSSTARLVQALQTPDLE